MSSTVVHFLRYRCVMLLGQVAKRLDRRKRTTGEARWTKRLSRTRSVRWTLKSGAIYPRTSLNASHISRTLIRDVRWVFCRVSLFCPIWIFRFKDRSTSSLTRVYRDSLNFGMHICMCDMTKLHGSLVQMIL